MLFCEFLCGKWCNGHNDDVNTSYSDMKLCSFDISLDIVNRADGGCDGGSRPTH